MKKLIAAFILLVTGIFLFAQKDPQPKQQWEYLIISPGETYFTGERDTGLDMRMKLLRYGGGNFASVSEAMEAENTLDKLGSFGWELVAIVGTIGGDQQFVFKRPLDVALTAIENKKAKDALEKQTKAIAAATAIKPPVVPPVVLSKDELVDLDALDAAKKQELSKVAEQQSRAEFLTTVDGIFKNYKGFSITITEDSWSQSGGLNITIHLDCTPLITDGNKYRVSEVDPYFQKFLDSFRDGADIPNVERGIQAIVIMEAKVNGSIKTLGRRNISCSSWGTWHEDK